MVFGVATDKGKVREQNEDSYGCKDNLFIVADGMGGHQAGEIASSIAVETILASDSFSNTENDLKETIILANNAILAAVSENTEHYGMGTTVVVLKIFSDTVIIGHVGDSRIYQLNHQEEFNLLTNDHSLVAELVKNGEITEDEAKNHPQRNILTKALGTKGMTEVDVRRYPVQPGDKFILCSDGLTNMVDETLIRDVLIQSNHPQKTAEKLVEMANDKGGIDNITVMAVFI